MTSSACGICGADSITEVVARRGAVRPVVTCGRSRRRWSPRCPTDSGWRSPRSTAPAGCMPQASSPSTATRSASARTSDVTTPSTRWSAGRCSTRRSRPREWLLQVSARASFELTQKAVLAGTPLLAAVSAPSTLAVDLARECGLTLVGFSRNDTFNCYSGRRAPQHRLQLPHSPSRNLIELCVPGRHRVQQVAQHRRRPEHLQVLGHQRCRRVSREVTLVHRDLVDHAHEVGGAHAPAPTRAGSAAFAGRICTAVTLYSGQFVAQSECSVVTTFAPLSGWWNVV